jgi:hypothetical protein
MITSPGSVTGTMSIAGSLALQTAGGYTVAIGTSIKILTAAKGPTPSPRSLVPVWRVNSGVLYTVRQESL